MVLVPGRLEHAFVLATTMRPKDVRELEALDMEPLEALLFSLKSSSQVYAALYDDVVGAMFGVRPLPMEPALGAKRVAELWFLTGHLFAEKPMAFFRASKKVVAHLRESLDILVNAIDDRHDDAKRFAVALGAELRPPVPMGSQGLPFVPFVFRRA